jgi:hypothetical protein
VKVVPGGNRTQVLSMPTPHSNHEAYKLHFPLWRVQLYYDIFVLSNTNLKSFSRIKGFKLLRIFVTLLCR